MYKIIKLNGKNKLVENKNMEDMKMEKMIKSIVKNNVVMEGDDMKSITAKVIEGQIKAQENMAAILRSLFEMNGIATPSVKNKEFWKLVDVYRNPSVINDWSKAVDNKDPRALKQLKTMPEWIEFVLTADNEDIKKFNEETTETEKQGVFLQCLTLLSHLNNIDRVGHISMLMETSLKSEYEIEKQRCWALATMLLVPELAA